MAFIVRFESILLLNSTWINQITHCRELVNLFSAKRKLNRRPKKGDSPKIYIKQKNPLLLGPHWGQSVSEAPFWILFTNMRLQKAFDPVMHPFGFCNGNIPFSNMETRDVIFYAIFVFRVIMYRPHWKQFCNFFLFQISTKAIELFFLPFHNPYYLLHIQLSDTLRTYNYICILTLNRNPGTNLK